MEYTTRNNGIDEIKMISIIMVVLCHSMPDTNGMILPAADIAIDLNAATTDIQHLMILLMKNGGMIANDIFVMISAWFLSEDAKVRYEKVVRIIIECFFVSVSISVVLLLVGYPVSKGPLLKSFFPIWMNANWYITCYLLLYMIHPALNLMIYQLNKEKLLSVLISLLFFYSFLETIHRGGFYYNDLIGFIVLYILIGYTKCYLQRLSSDRRINVIILIASIFMHIMITVLIDILGLRYMSFSKMMMRTNTNANPLFISIAWSSFNLARTSRVKCGKVNLISKMSMLIYIIHRNTIINGCVKYSIYKYIYRICSYRYLILWVVIYASGIFSLSLLVEENSTGTPLSDSRCLV